MIQLERGDKGQAIRILEECMKTPGVGKAQTKKIENDSGPAVALISAEVGRVALGKRKVKG